MAIGIILAAHPDDELIGCFNLLQHREIQSVIYIQQEDFPEERLLEMEAAAIHFKYVPYVVRPFDLDYSLSTARPYYNSVLAFIHAKIKETLSQNPEECEDLSVTVYAHSSTDAHAHHKLVNVFAKALPAYIKQVDPDLAKQLNPVEYYSVDMVNAAPLETSTAIRKRNALMSLYPSQHKLFDSNDKYFLFESFLKEEVASVTVSFAYEGIHCYPDAPEEVAFLRNPHRHIFHVYASLEVFHDDRDIEFILLKRELHRLVSSNMDNKSCEMAAREIIEYLYYTYPARKCKVTVSEDNENSATISAGL